MIYDDEREKEDLKFVTSFRKKLVLFSSKEKRLWHRAKWWGCWLRHYRTQSKVNVYWYIIRIQYCLNSKELKAFQYINSKK